MVSMLHTTQYALPGHYFCNCKKGKSLGQERWHLEPDNSSEDGENCMGLWGGRLSQQQNDNWDMHIPHQNAWLQYPPLILVFSFQPAKNLGESKESSSCWVLATHFESLHRVPGSKVKPQFCSSHCRYLRSRLVDVSIYVPQIDRWNVVHGFLMHFGVNYLGFGGLEVVTRRKASWEWVFCNSSTTLLRWISVLCLS